MRNSDEFAGRQRQHVARLAIEHADRIVELMRKVQDDLAIVEADRETFHSAQGFDSLNIAEWLRDAAGTAYMLAHDIGGIDVTAKVSAIAVDPDGGTDQGDNRRPWR